MRSEGEGQATGLHCGECMVVEGELVALLPSGRCPKCGADYGDVLAVMRAAKREADQALVEVSETVGCPACNFGKAVCGCGKAEEQTCPRCGHTLVEGVCRMNMPWQGCGWRAPGASGYPRGTQYYPEGKWGDE